MASLRGSTVKDPTGQPVGLERVSTLHTPLEPLLTSQVVLVTMKVDAGVRSPTIIGGLTLVALDHKSMTSG